MKTIIIMLLSMLVLTAGLLNAGELGDKPFRAACAQIFVGDNVEVNLGKYLDYIAQADEAGAELVVFPEASLSGYGPEHFRDSGMPSSQVLLAALDKVKDAARKHGIWVLAGTSTWRGDELYNDVIMIDNNGVERASYAKVQLTDGDVTFYQPGQELKTFTHGSMSYGMQICFDIRFPEPWRVLALSGARVIFHSAQACGSGSWKIPVWEGHLRSRAAENGIWVVSCNAAGPVQMGRSYIINPDGLAVASSNQDREELITGLVDLSKVSTVGVASRRTDLYRLLPVDSSEGKSIAQ
jgi:predicted amidohydrolase